MSSKNESKVSPKLGSKNEKDTSFFKNSLQYIKPFVPILPHVKNPLRSPVLNEKVIWTLIAILIYLVASQIPLFGIVNFDSPDPLSWMRIMMASNRGSLMDLGISPVVSASIVVQALVGLRIVRPDYSIKEDKILMETLQKLIGIIIVIGQAILQIISGTYGPASVIGMPYSFLIFLQLFVSGIIIILLDEMIQKDYGLGNGVNLFIITNLCEHIVWNAISPKAYTTGRSIEFEGCLVSAIHLLIARSNKLVALYELLFRANLPNLSSLIATLAVFITVVYLQAIRVEIPISSTKAKGVVGTHKVSLFYTSTTPIIIQSYVISHFSTISRFLFNKFPTNMFVRFLGVWDIQQFYGYIPVGGISYYIFPPRSFSDMMARPVFSILYIIINLLISGILCTAWSASQEDTPEKVHARIKANDMQLSGLRDSSALCKLRNHIYTAAFLGGVITSAAILFCNIASTIGSGNNIMLAASIINQYMKLLEEEASRKNGISFMR